MPGSLEVKMCCLPKPTYCKVTLKMLKFPAVYAIHEGAGS